MEGPMSTRNRAKRAGLLVATDALLGMGALYGCGSDSGNPASTPPGSTTRGGTSHATSGAGGAAAGGRTSSIGGAAFTTGGQPAGAAGLGGLSPNGGLGTGSSAAGSPSSGGKALGGSAAGGTTSPAGGSAGSAPTGGGSSATGGTGGGLIGGRAAGGTAQSGGTANQAGTAQSGGSATGGMATGGAPTGGAAAGITKDAEVLLTDAGLTIVSYGGYLNGESFQQDGIVSYGGYQYAAFWNTSRHVVMARRQLPSGSWSSFEFTDYLNTVDDAHNTISLGICPGDGTLHLSFDHHGNDLHYRRSVTGLVTNPATIAWAVSSFSATTSSLVAGTTVSLVTYPRFVTEPGGNQLLFGARIGGSGAGDEYLWEYDASTQSWTSLGKYIDGIVNSVNAYPHGLSYTRGGSRLHLSWCWRDTPDATTNHDLLYIYSDDHGRTWRDNAGATVATTGSSAVTLGSAGIRVWTINQNRGLINQEHMAVDSTGRVHVLLSHMPDAQADDAVFANARTKSQFFHYWRDTQGAWTRTGLGLPVVANFRGKLAISSTHNVYAILPNLRIAGASAASGFADWTLLDTTDNSRFFSDPLIDTARLETEDKLTIYYPVPSSSNIYTLDYTLR
jgi:hypothetical protein